MTWVLETSVFQESGPRLRVAVEAAGHAAVEWDDAWWASGAWAQVAADHVLFHGALANAARVHDELPWRPGSYCDAEAFRCTAWYERAHPWLLNQNWRVTTVAQLCDDRAGAADGLTNDGQVFVRPDSPLKPFSGRVLQVDQITPEALDHGYYYTDMNLPVLLAPVMSVSREWRFVVAHGAVVAGCEYEASSRATQCGVVPNEVAILADAIAEQMEPPADVYVLDLGESEGAVRLLELNPFGGADLYDCDPHAVVGALA